jgi:aspartyl-tRNA(Asn)/glutamyl-tRNA(Gln) amidotransferase subunit C
MIGLETVRHVARLSRLELSEVELERMVVELSGVLAHIETMAELDLDGVPPTSHVVAVENALREDVPVASLDRARILADAPSVVADGFAVPSPQA